MSCYFPSAGLTLTTITVFCLDSCKHLYGSLEFFVPVCLFSLRDPSKLIHGALVYRNEKGGKNLEHKKQRRGKTSHSVSMVISRCLWPERRSEAFLTSVRKSGRALSSSPAPPFAPFSLVRWQNPPQRQQWWLPNAPSDPAAMKNGTNKRREEKEKGRRRWRNCGRV